MSGRSVVTDHNIQRLALQDGSGPIPLHFDVNGLATTNTNGNRQVGDVTFQASSSGSSNGNLILLPGSIFIRGQTLEVVPGSGGPGV